ncbi:uncharacterized protein LOC121892073 isoform X2 [Thunnus maccoyii]|uniref:uncharacterized protein LOC121892073 isoform X2 n=1 Tax=Thunnus maccoyii TaxID=8240 RepID=UPI001C4CC860|nr:uncharacterized protein LOC121892073 isoform X2 [Thunnus maccoyii]
MTATTSAVGHYGPFIPMKEERRQKTRRGAGTERRTVTKEYMSREDKVQGRRQEQRLGETFLPTRRHCRGVLTCASVKWISLHKMPMREEDTLSALTARLSGMSSSLKNTLPSNKYQEIRHRLTIHKLHTHHREKWLPASSFYTCCVCGVEGSRAAQGSEG